MQHLQLKSFQFYPYFYSGSKLQDCHCNITKWKMQVLHAENFSVAEQQCRDNHTWHLKALFSPHCYRADLILKYPPPHRWNSIAKSSRTRQDWTFETKPSESLQYSHWIWALLTCIKVCLMDYIKGLLCVLNKLQDQPACQMTNVGLQLLDLAKFRAYRERLLWNGDSALGSLWALTHIRQQINIGWLQGLPPPAMCSGQPRGLATHGKVPPAHGQLLPRHGFRLAMLRGTEIRANFILKFVTLLSFCWSLTGRLICLQFRGQKNQVNPGLKHSGIFGG